MTGTELTRPDDAQLERAVAAILDGTPLPFSSDPEAVSRGILERILTADSYDEIFKPQSLDAWREHLGRPAEVIGFHLNPTSFESENEESPSSSVYAVVDLVWLDDSEPATVTCGGRNVMMQLVQALRKGLLPARVKLSGKRTGEGYQALWLESV